MNFFYERFLKFIMGLNKGQIPSWTEAGCNLLFCPLYIIIISCLLFATDVKNVIIMFHFWYRRKKKMKVFEQFIKYIFVFYVTLFFLELLYQK